MLTTTEINTLALSELVNANELAAQTLFRNNAKKSPCCLTLNNLGVFYIQYGMTLQNGCIRSAKKIGLRYLLKAASCDMIFENLVSVATALLEEERLNEGYKFLLRANSQSSDPLTQYNLGACLIQLNRFYEAIPYLESLCTKESSRIVTKNGGQHPYLLLSYCHVVLNDIQKAQKYIQKYRAEFRTSNCFDVFYLRYLCGLYTDALSESQELLEEWYPSNTILALLAECLSFSPAYKKTLQRLISEEGKNLWQSLIVNPKLRHQFISEYLYRPPTICLYQFCR